jgi:hypothetical protein
MGVDGKSQDVEKYILRMMRAGADTEEDNK